MNEESPTDPRAAAAPPSRLPLEGSVVRLPDGTFKIIPKAPKLEGSMADAARILGVSPRHARRLCVAADSIKVYRPGALKFRVDLEDVRAFKAASEVDEFGRKKSDVERGQMLLFAE